MRVDLLLLMIPYFISHCILGAAIISAIMGWRGFLPFFSLLLCLGLILDCWVKRDRQRSHYLIPFGPRQHARFWQILIYSFLVLFIVATATVLVQLKAAAASLQEINWFPVLAVLFVSGLAVATIHEFVHGSNTLDHWAAFVLSVTCGCPYFMGEHIRGHHRNLGTLADPATARRGENFYRYFERYICGVVIDCLALRQKNRSAPHSDHAVGSFRGILTWFLLLCVGVQLAFGVTALLFLLSISILANGVLALANYIQHYGLRRGTDPLGRPAPITDAHSWTSFSLISNWLMFNLPIHAPHHADTSEGGHTLATNGPVLPAGYLVMLWLPLLPAIWRRVMDHRSELWPEDMQKEIRS